MDLLELFTGKAFHTGTTHNCTIRIPRNNRDVICDLPEFENTIRRLETAQKRGERCKYFILIHYKQKHKK